MLNFLKILWRLAGMIYLDDQRFSEQKLLVEGINLHAESKECVMDFILSV